MSKSARFLKVMVVAVVILRSVSNGVTATDFKSFIRRHSAVPPLTELPDAKGCGGDLCTRTLPIRVKISHLRLFFQDEGPKPGKLSL